MVFEVSSDNFRIANSGIGENFWSKKGRTDYRFEVSHEDKTIYVIGRPSSERKDWLDNLDFRIARAIKNLFSPEEKEPNKPKYWFKNRKDIKVHAGFLRQYEAVQEEFLALLEKYPDYEVKIWGFSLGASWTQILLEDFVFWAYIKKKWPERKVAGIFYSCGNPWRKLPKEIRKLVKKVSTFVIPWWDPVTWMRVLRFFRYGKEIKIGKWYRFWPIQHHPEQIIRALDERS